MTPARFGRTMDASGATRFKDGKINPIRPRPAWIPYFEELLASRWSRERETRLELATTYLEGRRSTN
jgi:hypothetical protein